MLKLSNIKAGYGSVNALKDISLSVQEGQVVALLGSNGAGKSTILKCITNLVSLQAGTIEFLGERIDRLRPEHIVRRGMVMVPEGRQVFPELTVMENLKLGSYTRKDRAGINEDLEYVLRTFPILQAKLENLGGTLSGGQQQMLAIGRGLMARPKMLLLDEPSLGLAPIIVQEIFSIIRKIKERGTTILLVEQNANMALDIADYAYVVETGNVSCEGPPPELKQNDEVRRSYLGG